MTDLLVEDPCVVFALPRESMTFRREFRPQQRFPGAPCWAKFCGPAWLTVLVLHAGMGKKRIAQGSGLDVQAINRLLKQHAQMQKMMKKLGGGGMGKMMKQLNRLQGQLPGAMLSGGRGRKPPF